MKNKKQLKKFSNFSRYASVLSKGFNHRDATPPSMPSYVGAFREVGIYDKAKAIKKNVDKYKI